MDEKDQTAKFLEGDFNQCFQQMRHYDSQLFDSVKFVTTAYVGLIGIGIGIYEFGVYAQPCSSAHPKKIVSAFRRCLE